jgi:hypothetical protein
VIAAEQQHLWGRLYVQVVVEGNFADDACMPVRHGWMWTGDHLSTSMSSVNTEQGPHTLCPAQQSCQQA